ncbi:MULTISPECIES: ATP synthase subunit I [unclassified Psychrobacillus]|uniref:ATP synthase subunit I n=1 Tax=unclassified Psychrobacillus TaxID=2636677 RepID=UPI00146A3FFA|nr:MULTISPECIES: ATP synthase subunit I [unclassified Psychrobacillus]MCM3356441.1 ATP synthase subunit I [Psychrobacillus sp. MER TA 171]NME05736.1 ATP synthase subunit I [Psychrobacillus sp. BL-248-WT-3]
MLEMQRIFTRQKKYIFFLLAICVLGWAFTPYPAIFAGLAVGSLFGLYNFWILVRRMEKFDRVMLGEKGRAGLGTSFRFASGIAAVAIALIFPDDIHLISTVIGLMIPYVLLIVERILLVRNQP